MWQFMANSFDHFATNMEEFQGLAQKGIEGQAELVAELKKISQCLQAVQARKQQQPPPKAAGQIHQC